MFKYNAGTHVFTGYSTFHLLHGFELNQPIDLTLIPTVPDHDVLAAIKVIYRVRQNLPRLCKRYNAQHKERPFKVGELK